jgi:hypothetical protein
MLGQGAYALVLIPRFLRKRRGISQQMIIFYAVSVRALRGGLGASESVQDGGLPEARVHHALIRALP